MMYIANHYNPASFANQRFHSGERQRQHLVLSISQSVDLSQPFPSFPHIGERTRVSLRGESHGEHA